MNSDVKSFFARSRVERIEDLFCFFAGVACSIEHPTHHERVGDSLLVDWGLPRVTELGGVTLIHFGQHQVAKVPSGGIDHPDTWFIRRQIQVREWEAFIKMAKVALGIIPE